jgi:hypothetical protein
MTPPSVNASTSVSRGVPTVGLIDAHCHVDKTLFGGRWVPHSAGPALADRIAEERRRRGELELPNVEHMTALLEQMVASGTTHVRTHKATPGTTIRSGRRRRGHLTPPPWRRAPARSRWDIFWKARLCLA